MIARILRHPLRELALINSQRGPLTAIKLQRVSVVEAIVRQPGQRRKRSEGAEQNRQPFIFRDDQQIERDERNQEPAFIARERRGVRGGSGQQQCPDRLGVAEPQRGPQQRGSEAAKTGSVIGVLDRYSMFGFSANTSIAAKRGRQRSKCPVRGGKEENRGEDEAGGRWNHSGEARSPPVRVHHKRNHQQVRQRQPDGADLFRPGCPRIENAARDVQMRLGIAVIKDVAVREGQRAAAMALRLASSIAQPYATALKRRESAEFFKAGIDFGACERAESLHAKAFAAEASHHGAVNHGAAQHSPRLMWSPSRSKPCSAR